MRVVSIDRQHAAAFLVVLALFAGCGGDDGDDGGDGGNGGSGSASVGDCIDADEQVVDCGSEDATHELVSDQDDPEAIACIQIGDKPQTEVEVDGKTFCAEER